MAKEERKWFLRSLFVRLTHDTSKKKIQEEQSKLEIELTDNEIRTIQEVMNIKMTNGLISKINKKLKSNRAEERRYAKQNRVKPQYNKAEAVIGALSDTLEISIVGPRETDIKNSIQQRLTEYERRKIIEKTAKTARRNVAFASLITAVFISGGGTTKALTEATNTQQNKNKIEVNLNTDEYKNNIESVEITGITKEDSDGNKSFRASLIVDGTEVDANEAENTENIEASIDSTMSEINSPTDVKDYINSIFEEEYNDVTQSDINVSNIYVDEDCVYYIDDEGIDRFSREENEGNKIITSIEAYDENGNETTLNYALIGEEYIRVYEEGEEYKGKQKLEEDVIDVVQQGLLWSEEYYNEGTLKTVDENGQEIIRTDEDGNELHVCDIVEEDFKNFLLKYRERKINDVINNYIQESDSDGIEPGD